MMLAALAGAAITLVAAAVIGGRHAESSTAGAQTQAAAGETQGTTNAPGYGDLVKGPAVGAQSGGGPTSAPGSAGKATATAPGNLTKSGERKSLVGATREGVFKDYFEFGIHGPLTLDGAPLNLAEDPVTGLKGYVTYINRHGGVNGLKVRLFIVDDRYTVQGGQQAADKLVKEIKPFFISGTLGIDQIAKVAKAARSASIPYFAGGGPEPEFRNLMYQNLSNYDQDAHVVADFVCKYGAQYVGGKQHSDVRIGTSTLQSENILPVEKRFIAEVTQRGCVKTPVSAAARGTIKKPTEQSSYQDQMIKLRTAYGSGPGGETNLIIPFQDPITTSRQVVEWAGSGYRPKWTIMDFAHESNTVLELMHGEWSTDNPSCPGGTCRMRVMSLACYYHPEGGGDPYNPAKCAQMGEAHRDWVSLGQVDYDQNAGGSAGGHSNYNYTEDGWHTDGSGGAAGYQWTHFWLAAMKAIGTDPTREKFVAALNAYSNFSDLITGPITFRGSSNTLIGNKKFVLFEARSASQGLEWRQVTEITPSLVDHF
jgi:ABC-type branched-subunit amino acid transport system substrate-binding protein